MKSQSSKCNCAPCDIYRKPNYFKKFKIMHFEKKFVLRRRRREKIPLTSSIFFRSGFVSYLFVATHDAINKDTTLLKDNGYFMARKHLQDIRPETCLSLVSFPLLRKVWCDSPILRIYFSFLSQIPKNQTIGYRSTKSFNDIPYSDQCFFKFEEVPLINSSFPFTVHTFRTGKFNLTVQKCPYYRVHVEDVLFQT